MNSDDDDYQGGEKTRNDLVHGNRIAAGFEATKKQ